MRQSIFTLVLACCFAIAGAGGAAAADGSLDPTFVTDAEFPGYGFYVNPNGSPNFTLDSVGAVVGRPDGKIWLVGRMKGANSVYRVSLYRVQPDGYPDVDFGSLGLRTVVGPCTDFSVAAAALDAQERLVVAIDGCADFTIYRFLANGDLDFSLAGTGVLTVPFNQGGSNTDHSQHVAITAAGGIVVAGTVATATTNNLGIAHYSANGQPMAGFGVNGKVQVPFEWSVPEIRGVNGLHLMADGRIVVAGMISETSQSVSDKKQFVVRLLANGAMDPSYGNTSAGLSKINLRTPLGVLESPHTAGSLLETDGSVVQVGRILSNQVNSAGDIFLLRWRPDGQLDTGIGAHGVRQYALDFAGPNPADPSDNFESASAIARQGDGKYVIVGSSNLDGYPATALLRLKRNFSVDTSFGSGGKIHHTLQISVNSMHGQTARPILLQPGRIVVGGSAFTGLNGRIQMMMGVSNDLLFADTYD
jgi:uncharacterized delta-60 repeat protein